MGILVGSTGFVGSHLARWHTFENLVHRSDVVEIVGLNTDLLVCAGLPAEKWRANKDPSTDWSNMASLAQVLTSVDARRAVLISTIDVYQPAVGVNESDPAHFDGTGAYGTHRAWFESFFRSQFSNSLVLRLPALYAPDVRKNLVHDLLHGKAQHWREVNPASTFQFLDVTKTGTLIEQAWGNGISLMNLSSEPVTAQEVADVFGVKLSGNNSPVQYDTRSIHAEALGGRDGYLFTAETVLEGIGALLTSSSR